MVRRGKPSWTEDDFRRLLDKLGCTGYGWLRPEGVRRELESMAELRQDSSGDNDAYTVAEAADESMAVLGQKPSRLQAAKPGSLLYSWNQVLGQRRSRAPAAKRGWLSWLFGRK
jgi:hypothetical protein